jgi:hypothetical protein
VARVAAHSRPPPADSRRIVQTSQSSQPPAFRQGKEAIAGSIGGACGVASAWYEASRLRGGRQKIRGDALGKASISYDQDHEAELAPAGVGFVLGWKSKLW